MGTRTEVEYQAEIQKLTTANKVIQFASPSSPHPHGLKMLNLFKNKVLSHSKDRLEEEIDELRKQYAQGTTLRIELRNAMDQLHVTQGRLRELEDDNRSLQESLQAKDRRIAELASRLVCKLKPPLEITLPELHTEQRCRSNPPGESSLSSSSPSLNFFTKGLI